MKKFHVENYDYEMYSTPEMIIKSSQFGKSYMPSMRQTYIVLHIAKLRNVILIGFSDLF